MRQAGPKSVVMWGGKSKVLAPGKKKENLKKGFQALQKLNASRVIRKDAPLPNTEFKGRYKVAQDKGKYKKRRDGSDLSSDKNSNEELAAQQRPAKSKDKYKKYRDVVQLKTADDDMKQKPAQSKDKYRKASSKVKVDEDAIGGDEEPRRPVTGKDKYKKSGKKEK